MKKSPAVLAALVGLATVAGHSSTLEETFQKASSAARETQMILAAAPATRTRSEFTTNKIPVAARDCSAPRYFKDPIERPRVGMEFEATFCKEKLTFQEREDGTEGRGIFRRTKWVRIPGSEKTTYEYGLDTESFDLSYDPDSFRTPQTILRDLKDSCESRRREMATRALNERNNVRCQ